MEGRIDRTLPEPGEPFRGESVLGKESIAHIYRGIDVGGVVHMAVAVQIGGTDLIEAGVRRHRVRVSTTALAREPPGSSPGTGTGLVLERTSSRSLGSSTVCESKDPG